MRSIRWFLLIIAYLVINPLYANTQYQSVANDPTHMRIYTLNNGLTVYLAQNKDEPRIQTYIAVRAGSNNDPSDNTGLAHYLEHMLFKGSSKIGTLDFAKEKPYLEQISQLYEQHKAEADASKRKQLYQKIDQLSNQASRYAIANEYQNLMNSLGAQMVNAHTWVNETVYTSDIPANALTQWLRLEKERMSDLILRLFHTELEVVYEEFNQTQDSNNNHLMSNIFAQLFPHSNYGLQTTIGHPEHLKKPSMRAIHQYFEKYYVPSNMAIVLVGDLDYEQTIAAIEQTFGQLPAKPTPEEYIPTEADFKQAKTITVTDPDREQVVLNYRLAGSQSNAGDYAEIIKDLLDGEAGLLELDLNLPQKVAGSGAYVVKMKDYTLLTVYAYPKQGQSLEQVKQLLTQEIDKIKAGDFEDWMLSAFVKKIKKIQLNAYLDRNSVASEAYDSFINRRDWKKSIDYAARIAKITKSDIIQFSQNQLSNNLLIVNKVQGVNKDTVHVEKPKITPIHLNQQAQSDFYKQFTASALPSIAPKFVDFSQQLKTEKITANSTLYSIYNHDNNLASVTYFADIGSDHDRKLALAFEYMDYLGTSQYNPLQLKQELYKRGISINLALGERRSFITVTGLNEDLLAGINFLEQTINDYQASEQSYQDFVNQILNERINAKTNNKRILGYLNTYAQYKNNSRALDIFSEQELKAIKPSELTRLVKNYFNYQHHVFYYGNQLALVKSAIKNQHHFGKQANTRKPKQYIGQANNNRIYFFDYPQSQVNINFITKGKTVNPQDKAVVGVLNAYFGAGMSSMVFQQIRESQALAYTAVSIYSQAGRKNEANYLYSMLATQSDKLVQASDSLLGLLNHPLPENQMLFLHAKNSFLNEIETTRYNRQNIFYYWLSLQDLGINYDFNKDTYQALKQLKFSDIAQFHQQNIQRQNYNLAIMGDKTQLDINYLKKLGTIEYVTLEQIFGY